MATSNTNPFADFASSVTTSRIGMPAAERNYSERMERERFRQSRERAAGAAPTTQSADTTAANQPAAQASPVPAPTAPRVSSFSGMAAMGSASRNLSARAPAKAGFSATSTPSAPAAAAAPATRLAAASSDDSIDFDNIPMELIRPVPDKRFGAHSALQAPAAAPKKTVVWTPQQEEIIACNDQRIVVDAFAGCAKTTTAIGYTEARPHGKILYLCLNTANAEEARQRFPKHVTCATTHSIAGQAIRPNWNRVTREFRPKLVMQMMNISDQYAASNMIAVLSAFFNSSDVTLSEKHAAPIAEERDLNPQSIDNAVALASLAWKRMNDSNDTKMMMPDDAYLKMFALRAPQLPYDTIIFDEAQDANPVTMQIIAGQKHVKLLCIGDRHQSIYAFRGSVNAMEKFQLGATRFHLSQTFRFGPKIAALANTILSELKGEKTPIVGMGKDGTWDPAHVTTISRTNAELFRIAAPRRGEGVHWVGGKLNKRTGDWEDGCHGYRLTGVLDAYNLYARNRSEIKSPLMRNGFPNWDSYVKYSEVDNEAKILVTVVEEFTHEIPDLVDDIIRNAVRDSKDAEVTLTTGHKSKGLEWECVQISDDMEVLAEAEKSLSEYAGAKIDEQDINLLYVMATRAKGALKPNADTTQWLEALPQHRNAREAAKSRAAADTERIIAADRTRRALEDRP